jgi:exodeoxyribonuclease VII small subunit
VSGPAEPTFEEAREELERIVHRLEDGSTSLDEALALWERGEHLHALCRAKLDQAETRVAELLERMGRPPAASPAEPPTSDQSGLR